jgi:excisionase family DNA binding protein
LSKAKQRILKSSPAIVFPAQNSQLQPRGFRISEAAAYLGVSPWFVELKIRSKELPALKLCHHYTILKEDLDSFLDAERKKIAA